MSCAFSTHPAVPKPIVPNFTFDDFFTCLQFFKDSTLVNVLAAYARAEAPLSERECAARTGRTRKTVRLKRRALLELGVLCRERPDAHNGQSDPCRFDQDVLNALISTSGVILPRSEPESGVILPRSEPPTHKERAPAPASCKAKELKAKELAVTERQQIEEAITEAVGRSRLTELAGKKLTDGDTLRNLRASVGRLPHDWQVREVLDWLEGKCRQQAAHPSGKTWGWIVGGARGEVNARIGPPLERKPPGEEFRIAEIAQRKAMR